MRARNYDDPSRRLRQLERVLLIVELLAPLRRGATTDEIARDLADTLGVDYSERTIKRDLIALKEMGLVEPAWTGERRPGGGPVPPRWRWLDRSPRAAAIARAADVQAERRDTMQFAEAFA